MRALWFLSITALVLSTSASPVVAVTPITPVPPQAVLRVAAVQVRVVLDHRDWTYQIGETPKFRISVVADNEPIDNASVTYAIAPDMVQGETKMSSVPLDGLVVEGGSM